MERILLLFLHAEGKRGKDTHKTKNIRFSEDHRVASGRGGCGEIMYISKAKSTNPVRFPPQITLDKLSIMTLRDF